MNRFTKEEVHKGFSACRTGKCYECPYADYAVDGECSGAEMILDDLYFYLSDDEMWSALEKAKYNFSVNLKADFDGNFAATFVAKNRSLPTFVLKNDHPEG